MTMTERLHKTVDLTDEVDDDRRIATGAVLVPNQIDSQGDYFEPGAVREIATDYMARLQRGAAGLKFMHAVGAGGKLSLVENRVLDSPERIGDTQRAAGTWVVSVKAHDPETWQAFKSGLFGGFSIGGEITDDETMAAAAVPDTVTVPEDHPKGVSVRRIDDAMIREFSAVDRPAVPDATVDVLKAEKADERLADPDRTVEALVERGHSREDARLIRDVMHKSDDNAMNDDTDTTKAEYSTNEWVSWEASGGRARGQVVEVTENGTFDDAISGDITVEGTEDEPAYLIEVWRGTGDDASAIEEEAGRGDTMHVAHQEATLRRVDDPREAEASKSGIIASLKSLFQSDDASEAEDSGADLDKVGRTLSRANEKEAKAVHDAAATMLNRNGARDHKESRTYTGDPDDDFEMSEHHEKALDESPETTGAATDTESDSLDDTDADKMTDDDTNDDTQKSDEPPAWAESIDEKVESIDKRVAELEDEDGDGAEKDLNDAPDWAQDLDDKVDALNERVDKVAKAGADTDQVGGADETTDDPDEASAFKTALGGN